MKVSDVMSTQVESVNTDSSVRDISRLIFGRGINGVPVVKKGRLVGFITEKDILTKFYPTAQEYIEDPVNTVDFEKNEARIAEIFSIPAERIMSKNPTTVRPNTPLLKAQSIMFTKKVGRLPVVDDKGSLVGIISKGDIFRQLVGKNLKLDETEEYNDWISKHYFLTVDWNKRLDKEIPDLVRALKKENVKNILDIGSGIGEHAIALAKAGFNVFAFERSELMIKDAKKKAAMLPEKTKKRLRFFQGEFEDLSSKLVGEFDAAIFMGNSISHNPHYREVIQKASEYLSKKAIMIFQVSNFEKVLSPKRFSEFSFVKGKDKKEYAFLEYYDLPRVGKKKLVKTFATFDFDGNNWKFYGLRNSQFAYINKDEIGKILKKNGFSKTQFFGASYENKEWDFLFRKPFRRKDSHWMNIISKRH